jgi:hypothetical protein
MPAAAAQVTAMPDHAPWGALLARFAAEGTDGVTRVDYAGLKADAGAMAALDAYIAALEAADPASMEPQTRKAFWINLYNAVTVRVVARAWPVASIKDIGLGGSLGALFAGGPWSAKLVRVAGEDLSLDDIEHVKLRKEMPDPRIHFVVNCASIGCPNLGKRPYAGETLDAQMDAATRAYVNHWRGVRFDEQGRMIATRLIDWYAGDFGGRKGAIAFLKLYADPDLRAKIEAAGRVYRYEYDWAVNAAGEKAP